VTTSGKQGGSTLVMRREIKMGREIKRVPLDFSWPFHMPWKGYMSPYTSQDCKVCDGHGLNPATKQIEDDWYNFADTGRRWCNNITQDEVDALIEAGRLMDFTHQWTQENGWKPIEPKPIITAEMVNDWSYRGMGHDAINRWICVKQRAKRLGVYGLCPVCEGEGSIWFNERVKQLSDDWYENERYDPPTGDAWQLWETTSEGSPISPPCETPEKLAQWLVDNNASSFGSDTLPYETWLKFIKDEQWAPSMVMDGQRLMSGVEASTLHDGGT
jgi:hypothetical protein